MFSRYKHNVQVHVRGYCINNFTHKLKQNPTRQQNAIFSKFSLFFAQIHTHRQSVHPSVHEFFDILKNANIQINEELYIQSARSQCLSITT